MDASQLDFCLRDKLFPTLPEEIGDKEHDILRGGNQIGEMRNVDVDIPMRENVQSFGFNEGVEIANVEKQSGTLVYFAGNGHGENIVMTVPIRVVALSEHVSVLLIC
jgi:hypothetical protein